jgi:hypothetical protein
VGVLAIVSFCTYNERESLASHTSELGREVNVKSERLAELGSGVGQHAHLASSLVCLTPRGHDERIVDGDAHDIGDALALDLNTESETMKNQVSSDLTSSRAVALHD